MRYFAHDGSTAHGPASVEELTARPWFDGDILVCPVGSEDPEDWKPALSYPEFKSALLAPKRAAAVRLEPLPPPVAARIAALPESAPSTDRGTGPMVAFEPCPHCGAGNPASARFCNACGWRMDGGKPLMEPAPSMDRGALKAPAEPASASAFASAPAFMPPAPQPPPSAPPAPAFTPPAPAAFAPPVTPPPFEPPSIFEPPQSPFEPAKSAFDSPLAGLPSEPPVPAYEPPALDALPEPAREPLPEPARPMERPPERQGPMSRGLSPYGGETESAGEHSFESLASQMPHPVETPSEEPPLAASPAPAAASPAWKRPPVLAAFAGAAALAAFAGWSVLKPAPEPAPVADSGADLNMPSPEPAAPAADGAAVPLASAGGPVDAAPAGMSPAVLAPSAKPAPSRPSSLKPQSSLPKPAPTPRPKRKSRPARPKPAPPPEQPDAADAILIESRAAADEPVVPGAQGSGSEPLADPGAGSAPADVLPGIPRRPSGLRAKTPKSAPAPKPVPDSDAALLDEALGGAGPSAGAAPAAAAAEAAKPAAPVNEADKLALQQAVEEFEFCAQLLAQGAFADHFDTCLCKETRKLPPYRDRRGFYAASLEKEAKAGRLEVRAEIVSTRMENGAARIVAKWKSRGNDPGREVDETWVMDDGLWCKAP